VLCEGALGQLAQAPEDLFELRYDLLLALKDVLREVEEAIPAVLLGLRFAQKGLAGSAIQHFRWLMK